MPAGVEMTRGVLVRRRVAATDVTAGHAQTQMLPLVADAQAILTTAGARRNVLDLIKMGAVFAHLSPLPYLQSLANRSMRFPKPGRRQ